VPGDELMTPYYQDEAVTIYHGDNRALVEQGLQFDSILTDPPYGKGVFKDNQEDFKDHVGWLVAQGCPLVFTCPVLSLWDIPKPQWVAVWEKPQSFGFWATPLYPHWEPICLYGFEGKGARQDIFVSNPQSPNGHPTPKPLNLMRELIQIMSDGTILDPFMGSGTTLRAAKDLGRKAIGIEIEERYCEIAANRMAQAVMELA
jgi:DNA modification methylase